MYPDKFQEGLHRFIECKSLHPVFNFVCQYVQRLHSDQWITKTLKNCPGASFFQIITPSNIAYVILLVNNCQEMWDQEMGIAGNQEKGVDEPKKEQGWSTTTAQRRTGRLSTIQKNSSRSCARIGNDGNRRIMGTESRPSRHGGRRIMW